MLKLSILLSYMSDIFLHSSIHNIIAIYYYIGKKRYILKFSKATFSNLLFINLIAINHIYHTLLNIFKNVFNQYLFYCNEILLSLIIPSLAFFAFYLKIS